MLFSMNPGTIFIGVFLAFMALYALVRVLIKGSKDQKKAILVSCICLAVATLSWIFNMGWYRFIMTVTLVPVYSTGILFSTNYFAARYFENSKRIKILNLLFIISYVAGNVLLPDFADIGEMYLFFALIRSDSLAGVAHLVSGLFLMAHVVLFVWQIVEILRTRSLLKKKTEEAAKQAEEK